MIHLLIDGFLVSLTVKMIIVDVFEIVNYHQNVWMYLLTVWLNFILFLFFFNLNSTLDFFVFFKKMCLFVLIETFEWRIRLDKRWKICETFKKKIFSLTNCRKTIFSGTSYNN